MRGVKPRWAHLLGVPQIASWHGNMARRNKSTADVYLRRLCRTVDDALGRSPVDLLSMDQPTLEDAVSLCIEHEFASGKLGSTVIGSLKSLKSFLRWHNRDVKRDNIVPGVRHHPNSENYQIPDQLALNHVLKAAELRTQAVTLLLAHGGQRPRVIGDIEGKDGLRLKDLRELRIEASDVVFTRIPTLVDVPRSLSKNGKPYFFFLGPEACNALRVYLLTRLRRGEKLGPDSPLIRAEGGPPRFVMRNNLSDSVRRAMGAAEIKEPPYIWRSYYANRCQLAESKGFLEQWRKFFMGHAGNIQTEYANRRKLPADSIETMRSAYSKALPYLESFVRETEDPSVQAAELILKAAGVDAVDLVSKPRQEMEDALSAALEDKSVVASEPPAETLVPPSSPAVSMATIQQRVVAMDEVAAAVAHGWIFRVALPGNLAIIEFSR